MTTNPDENQGSFDPKDVPRDMPTGVPAGVVGRFAPSPSGPLHFGSLISALASFLDARSKQGRWLLRIDDLDTPRTTAGSEDRILTSLRAHGLIWDDPVSRQSDHIDHYQAAVLELADRGQLFFCNCSRRSLKTSPVYPGTCRSNRCTRASLLAHLSAEGERTHAVRLRTNDDLPDAADTPQETVHDELQSTQSANDHAARGDYVVFRRDGLFSYQLAVVIDDALTGVNRVVRGADLLPTTARQQQLHRLLGTRPPVWLHLPVLLNERSTKLSKQAHSLPIEDSKAYENLHIALQLLGQRPPEQGKNQNAAQLIDWAINHWQPSRLPASETFETFFGW